VACEPFSRPAERCGYSQRELAELLNIKEQQVQRYESERYAGISLSRYQRILDTLSVELHPKLGSIDSKDIATDIKPEFKVGSELLRELRKRNWVDNRDRGHARIARSGVALRVTMTDLVRSDLAGLLATQVKNLSSEPSDCILVLDLTDADLTSPDEFAKFVAETLFKLRSFGTWAKIIVQATSYPIKNPALDNSTADVPRKEWDLWQAILKIDSAIRDFAMFGDFGADNAHIDFKPGGRPIPHLRYATATHWLISRGNREAGYSIMKSVADRVVRSGFFVGELFSVGDEYIAARASGANGVGNPMMWRSVNMNHHMTFVAAQLGELYGEQIPVNKERRHPVQQRLFEPQE
jgi:transcriptional regulator with XRE-family HTH domain